jgi:UDP-N-acetylglucosamine:LPS N-acetylglucosamine transferase
MKIMLIASTGGHLAQLIQLRDWWTQHERHWVTFQKADAVHALAGERVTWAFHPTTRNTKNAVRNLVLAMWILVRHRPSVVVSTGAGVAVPFFVVARVLRIRTAFLEVYDRIDEPTLTGRMCYPLSDVFLLQWPQQQQSYPDGIVVGPAW